MQILPFAFTWYLSSGSNLFFRYMYSDSVEISSETALALLYAAKKYVLPKLSEECSCLLQKSVKAENVCFLLDQSLLFSDGKLRENCLDFFSSNSDKILSSAEFLDCSRQAMDAILKIEKMKSKESVVFQNCVNWAKHQLRRHKFIENPSDEQIRETLGSLLYDFHFPTMELTEFADLVGRGNVLTGEEKSAIYYYLIRKQKPEFLPFRTNGRHPLEKFLEKMVDRTITVKQAVWQYESCKDGIDFRADADIQLSGLGLFSGIDRKQYNVDVEVLHIQESLCKKRFTIPFTGNSTPFKISFDSPIPLRAGLIYTIAAYAHGIIGYYGDSCKVICESDNITFTFSRYAGTESSGDEFRGQIPQLYFL